MKKAFDRIEFDSLFKALEGDGIDAPHLHLLALLYSNHWGTMDGKHFFVIERGVKQGDVISPILFNAALEMDFRSWKNQLHDEGWNIDNSMGNLTNSRFADDILLYAKSLPELQRISNLLLSELQKIGLEANASKSKILTTSSDYAGGRSVRIFNNDVEVQ